MFLTEQAKESNTKMDSQITDSSKTSNEQITDLPEEQPIHSDFKVPNMFDNQKHYLQETESLLNSDAASPPDLRPRNDADSRNDETVELMKKFPYLEETEEKQAEKVMSKSSFFKTFDNKLSSFFPLRKTIKKIDEISETAEGSLRVQGASPDPKEEILKSIIIHLVYIYVAIFNINLIQIFSYLFNIEFFTVFFVVNVYTLTTKYIDLTYMKNVQNSLFYYRLFTLIFFCVPITHNYVHLFLTFFILRFIYISNKKINLEDMIQLEPQGEETPQGVKEPKINLKFFEENLKKNFTTALFELL